MVKQTLTLTLLTLACSPIVEGDFDNPCDPAVGGTCNARPDATPADATVDAAPDATSPDSGDSQVLPEDSQVLPEDSQVLPNDSEVPDADLTDACVPQDEICNNQDDDCDGQIDEALVTACGSDIGACKTGTQTCTAGVFGECVGAISPSEELCNNVDDDCDGVIDTNSEPCGTDVGICEFGTRTCTGGFFSACVGGITPGIETCNGQDDDCDGETDEELSRACGINQGVCATGLGIETCTAGAWSECVGSTTPGLEICDREGQDEDCDGQINEDLTRRCGSTDVGECEYGTQTCGLNGWGICSGAIWPQDEICGDSKDNDCDGAVDNGCP